MWEKEEYLKELKEELVEKDDEQIIYFTTFKEERKRMRCLKVEQKERERIREGDEGDREAG